MNTNYIHLCEYATLTQEGKPTFVEVFSGIKTPSLPMQKDMYLVANFTNSEETSLNIVLKDPSGEEILNPFNEDVPAVENSGQGLMLRLKNVKLETEGEHKFNFYADEELVGSTTFIVEKT